MEPAKTVDLFNMRILNETRETALSLLLEPGERRTAVFINAHAVNTAADDPAFRWAVGKADILLPDGSGLQLAARLGGGRFVENLNGTDLFVPLCVDAAARGLSIYFFGARPGIAEAAAATAQRLAPGLTVAGTHHGHLQPGEDDAVIAAINASGADIVLVALGVPLQDVWIARNRARLEARLVAGVGAQFDFWSGSIARAPLAMRRMGAEWLWRLALEPRRLFARYVLGNPAFVVRAYADRKAQRRAGLREPRGKRLLDLVFAVGGLVALAPVLAVTAAAIRLESPGPVLFRQTRIGGNGKPFTLYKFRSMYRDAEARRQVMLAKSDRAGICFKAKADPRITRVGRVLRRFSLDELPQLLNVVKGEMGIVGPRPALPQEVAAYPAEALARLGAKPGLTGLWQVSGRAEIGFAKMVHMDTAYVRSRSIMLDLAIIALTVRAVVTGRGAY